MNQAIEVGFQAFVINGEEEVGAIHAVSPDGLDVTVYVENFGDFTVSTSAIVKVVAGKVIFDPKKLDERLRIAIGLAHASEVDK